MLPRLNLSTRFTLILAAVFLVGILIGGTAHWRALQGRAQEEITAQGELSAILRMKKEDSARREQGKVEKKKASLCTTKRRCAGNKYRATRKQNKAAIVNDQRGLCN